MKRLISIILSLFITISSFGAVPFAALAKETDKLLSEASVKVASGIKSIKSTQADSDAPTEGTCGTNAEWEYDAKSKVLDIGGIGSISDFSSASSVPWAAFKDEIEEVNIGRGITKVGNYSFSELTALKVISMPSTLTTIGNYSFSGCSALESFELPASVTSIGWGPIRSCSALSKITVSGENAVYDSRDNCNAIIQKSSNALICGCKNTTIPANITTIWDSAFYGCTDLTNITIPEAVTSIGSSAFRDCTGLTSITIPEAVTSIGSYAFFGCTGLTSITIPDGIKRIEIDTFGGCTGLTSVTIPASVNVIADHVFSGCTNIDAVNIESIDSLFNIIFTSETSNPLYYAQSLYVNGSAVSEITVPDNIKSISKYTFKHFQGLIKITLPEGTITIAPEAFMGCINLTEVKGSASKISVGDYSFHGCEKLTQINVSDGLTNVGTSAFSGCSSLSSIKLADTLTSIGSQAFYLCQNLTNISIPNGVTSLDYWTFAGCSRLKSVEFSENLTSIGNHTFYNCSSIEEISLPSKLATIDQDAFESCRSLVRISIPDSLISIGTLAFNGCTNLKEVNISSVNSWCGISFGGQYSNPLLYAHDLYLNGEKITQLKIPNDITQLNNDVFCGGTGLTSITIPESVTSIGRYAFYGCTGLTNITIPESVTSIGGCAFYGCTGLTSIIIPEGITSIGSSTFRDCTNLTNVQLPDTVSSIGQAAFRGCTSLNSIDIPENVGTIDQLTFYECKNLSKVILPERLSSIGYDAFLGCSNLVDIKIPESVTAIAGQAFSGCNKIETIAIPDSISRIEAGTFYNCKNLSELSIGKNISYIGDYAFRNCTNLSRITISEDNPVYDSRNNCNAIIESESDKLIFGSLGATIPDGVKTIGAYAFFNLGIKTIVIPESVNCIEANAFYAELNSVPFKTISILNRDCVIKNGAISRAVIYGYANSTAQEYAANARLTFKTLCLDGTQNHIFINSKQYCLNGCGTKNPNYDGRYNGNCGENAEWYFDEQNNTLNIYGKGNMDDGQPWSDYAPYIRNVVIEDGITSIGASAFKACNNITKVTVSDSVTSIGAFAFEGCPWLRTIAISDNVTSLGNNVFKDCKRLTLIEYSGTKAQWNSYSESAIKTTEIEKAVVYCSDGAIYDENLYVVENGAIYTADKKKLIKIISTNSDKEFDIPSGVEVISEGTCANSDVEVVNCSETITEIEQDALTGDNVKVVNFSDDIKTINKKSINDKTIAVVYHNSVTHKRLLDNGFNNIVSMEISNTSRMRLASSPKMQSSNITYSISNGYYYYTASAIKPTVIIRKNNNDISSNFTKVYKDNINVGRATINVTGKNSYKGVGRNLHFHICYNPSKMKMSISSSEYTYNGKAKKPSVTVKTPDGKKILSKQYTVSGNSATNVGKHTITITFKKNVYGNSGYPIDSGKRTIDFYIQPKGTKLSSVKSLKKGKNGMTVKWKAQTKQVDGYQIQYSTNKNFKGAKMVTVKGAKKTSKTIKGLRSKKKYYVRIRTYKTANRKNYFSAWSRVKSVKTK